MSIQVSLHVLGETVESVFERQYGTMPKLALRQHSVLNMGEDYSVLGQVIDLSFLRTDYRDDIPEKPSVPTQEIPEWASVQLGFGREKPTRVDKNGITLRVARACDLAKLVLPDRHVGAHPRDSLVLNKAVVAYMKCLIKDTAVVINPYI